MQVRSEQLTQHLRQGLRSCYVVSGNEPFLHQRACSLIRRTAKEQTFEERIVLHVDAKFDWSLLRSEVNSLSLFATKKLIELRCQKSSFDKKSNAELIATLDALADQNDIVLLISMPKLSAANKRSAWFKRIDTLGVSIQIWPLLPRDVIPYLTRYAQDKQLNINAEAVSYIYDKNQGNLLSACQELDKLELQFSNDVMITQANLVESLTQNSQYSAFDLSQSLLRRDIKTATQQLNALREEGEEPSLILWALLRDLRLLSNCLSQQRAGQSIQALLKKQYLPEPQKAALISALPHTSTTHLKQRYKACLDIEQSIKGLSSRDTWQLLERYLMI
ncbi:MAG: DNA polymerase III subunit delta [Pseudomonadota bacterium]